MNLDKESKSGKSKICMGVCVWGGGGCSLGWGGGGSMSAACRRRSDQKKKKSKQVFPIPYL